MKTHKDLEVWKNAIELVTRIYEVTKIFPKEELYGLTSVWTETHNVLK